MNNSKLGVPKTSELAYWSAKESTKARRGYDPKVQARIKELLEQLKPEEEAEQQTLSPENT
jgi:hypothetical protein